jgi:hypothetical protein
VTWVAKKLLWHEEMGSTGSEVAVLSVVFVAEAVHSVKAVTTIAGVVGGEANVLEGQIGEGLAAKGRPGVAQRAASRKAHKDTPRS